MGPLLASVLALALCFAGMAALSLAMDRHFQQVTGRYEPAPLQRLGLRAAGVALLSASLWPCVAGWGATVGFVAWWGFLTAGAMAVAAALPYRPRWMAGAAVACGGIAPLLALMAT